MDEKIDSETRARINGVWSQMEIFDKSIYSHCDSLSRCLQQSTLSAIGGQKIANRVVQTLKDLRSEITLTNSKVTQLVVVNFGH